MSEIHPTYDDEIDLFEFFETLWHGKFLISSFVAIAVLLGVGFLLLKDAVYESRVIYSAEIIPPFYDEDRIQIDFKSKFYSVNIFEEWKQNNSNALIVYEDFNPTKLVDGFQISRDEEDRLAILASEKKDGSFILIRSKQLALINDFFNYASHINDILREDYINLSQEEQAVLQALYNDLNEADASFADALRSVDRYVMMADKGANVFSIARPTMPKKVSPKPHLVLGISLFLGGMFGVFFVLVRNAIMKRKNKSATA